MAQNIGFRPIYKLETAADFKLLNDEMKALWIKIMGGLTQKDMNGAAWKTIEDAYSSALGTQDAHIRAIDQMNAEQNGRLKTLEDGKKTADTKIAALENINAEARIAALEEFKADAQKRITALESEVTALKARVDALEGASAT